MGIAIIVLWLLISGIRRGLKKGGRNNQSEDDNDPDGEK